MGGWPGGIFSITVVEALHALLMGPMKKSLEYIYNHTIEEEDVNKKRQLKKAFETDLFETNAHLIAKQLAHQSDRDLPPCYFNSAITTLSQIRGQEFVSLSLITILALPGCIDVGDDDASILIEKAYIDMLWKGISLYRIMQQESLSKNCLEDMKLKARSYIKSYKHVCSNQSKWVRGRNMVLPTKASG